MDSREATLQAVLLMDAAGRDNVLIETVGVGQAEVDVIDHADTIVLALMPGSGDSVQALKAGVMEIPDVIVVNKADHPMTDTLVREIKGVLALGHPDDGWTPPVIQTAGRARHRHRRVDRRDRRSPQAHRRAGHAARAPSPQPAQRSARAGDDQPAPRDRSGDQQDAEIQALLDQVVDRQLDPGSAAREILRRREGR